MKHRIYTLFLLFINISYMVLITLPTFLKGKEVSCVMLEQEESETKIEAEYIGLIGYLMSNEPSEQLVLHSIKINLFENDIAIDELKASQPETPPPNA